MISKISCAARFLLGLIYLVFGLNGFFNFIPMIPPPMPDAAVAFMGGMMQAPYFMPLLKGAESVGGLLLLIGVAAPFALVMLAPITLHIFLFHAVMTPGLENSVMPVIIGVAHVAAALAYWPIYRPLFVRSRT